MRLLRLQCLHPKNDQFQHLHSLALHWGWGSLIAPRVRANGGDRVRTTSVQAWRRLVTGRSMSDRMSTGGTMAGHGSNYVWFTLRWLYTEGTQVKLCPTRRLLIHHRDEGIWEGGFALQRVREASDTSHRGRAGCAKAWPQLLLQSEVTAVCNVWQECPAPKTHNMLLHTKHTNDLQELLNVSWIHFLTCEVTYSI